MYDLKFNKTSEEELNPFLFLSYFSTYCIVESYKNL